MRFSLGETKMDRIRNELIRVTTYVRRFGDKVKESKCRGKTCVRAVEG